MNQSGTTFPPIRNTTSTDHGRKGAPQRGAPISGKHLLLALSIMPVLAGSAGILTWGIVQIVQPSWTATMDFVVLVVAEVYATVLAALLLAFGDWQGCVPNLACISPRGVICLRHSALPW